MGLRRQLLFVATMTLALPWAGCQYVEEMERALRQGQMSALQATSQAVAARFSADISLLADISNPLLPYSINDMSRAFYVHPLKGDISVDGYASDWDQLDFSETDTSTFTLLDDDASKVYIGQIEDLVYLFIHAQDAKRQFYNPSFSVQASDHLRLRFDLEGITKELQVFSAAPGTVSVEERGPDNNWYRQHQISGVWNENESSYFVELRLPLAWVEHGLSIDVVDAELGEQQVRDETDLREIPQKSEPVQLNALRPVIVPNAVFDNTLDVFKRNGVKLNLTLLHGWNLGEAGKLHSSEIPQSPKKWVYRFVRWIVGQDAYPTRLETTLGGRVLGAELGAAFSGEEVSQWYSDPSGIIGRVITPFRLPNGMFAAVVAEQSTDSIEVLTTGAIGRLLLYCFLATMVVLIVLLSYASILSYRVRKLSSLAQQAVNEDGRVVKVFSASGSNDEIGELSRIYSTLLDRLHGYTSYLETLSGKLSHELRTPLAIVSSSLDNLQNHTLTSDAQIYVGRACEGVKRLSSILSAMSSASKLEQSLSATDMEVVDIADLLRQMVRAYSDTYQSCEMELSPILDESIFVRAAPELLVQMLDKLVENAVDFAGTEGCIRFELDRSEQYARLRVINNGPLLDEGVQKQIFDSLVSVRNANASEDGVKQHLGMGLYVVRLIVRFHQGEVRAYNHSDGARVVFEVELPLNQVAARQPDPFSQ